MGLYDDIIQEKRPVSYRRIPMERKHRAKQFAAFDALKGYDEAVRRQERIFEPYRELSEDQKEEIDRKLRSLAVGDPVQVTYFVKCADMPGDFGDYLAAEGRVAFLNLEERRMRVEDTEIPFDEVAGIEVDYA